MTIQAQWGTNEFKISQKQHRALEDVAAGYKRKYKSEGTDKKQVPDGHELQSFNLSYKVSPTVGGNAINEYLKFRKELGKSANLLVANTLICESKLMLHNVSMSAELISPHGEILLATITLDLKESEVEGAKPKASAAAYKSPVNKTKKKETENGVEPIAIKVLYNRKNITNEISISQCIHDMFATSQADTLLIKFNDSKRLWDGWKPSKNEIINVSYGIAKTGDMFINSVVPENGQMVLRASSIPPTAKDRTDKSWENVHLLQLAKEIAQRHGLQFENRGATDRIYKYVRQPNIPDFEFLQQRCNLESLAFVVYDKKLVLYDEAKLEGANPVKTLRLTAQDDFTLTDTSQFGYGKAIITNGGLVGEARSANNLSNVLKKKIQIAMNGQAEANRFARGLLRQENKNLTKGVFKYPLLREFSAGSVVKIAATGAKSWNGTAFISQIRQDYVNSKSKVVFRKAIF